MKLNIFGQIWKMVSETSLGEKEGICGDCDFENKTIRIDSSLKGQLRDETIIHEVGHAVLQRASWRQTGILTAPLEELLLDHIAKGVSENFKLSPRAKK